MFTGMYPRRDMGSICTVWDIPGNEKAIICYADSPQLAPTPSDFWVPKLIEATQGQWIYRNIQIHDLVGGIAGHPSEGSNTA